MPVHDWTRVDAGIFHAFHVGWVAELPKRLNGGLLPEGYYALAEQHAGRSIADVLTLHAAPQAQGMQPPSQPEGCGTAVATAPPKVRVHQTIEASILARRRSVAIRHVSGHRLVALLEVISTANKDRPASLEDFASKAVDALDAGVHLLVVDLFPPGLHDPHGIHEIIRRRLEDSDEAYELPLNQPLTLVSYAAGPRVEVYIEHVSVGDSLPEMPLFLRPDCYVNVPLGATYDEAYRGLPGFWRDVLEGKEPGVQ